MRHEVVEILTDEIGRPLSPGVIRRVRAFNPAHIEILAPKGSERVFSVPGVVFIRLCPDGYSIATIALSLAVEKLPTGAREFRGVLEDFSETGTEGAHWMVVDEDERGYDSFHVIEEGDHLTILDRLEERKLWAGKIRCDRKSGWRRYPFNPKYGQPAALGYWIHWTQRGFKPDEWAQYFIRPDFDRLRGVLRKKRS